jgi:catechol 2,3-dioxygenase-like lactoylglutathione lyase family enzyme
MKLNHLNLPVENVAESREFFEQYFDFKCIDTKGNDMLSVLIGTNGFTLVLMANQFNRNSHSTYPDALHIGFFVDTEEEVTGIYNRLKSGGIPLDQEPSNMRGVFGFYFHAPGNILTEVSSTPH